MPHAVIRSLVERLEKEFPAQPLPSCTMKSLDFSSKIHLETIAAAYRGANHLIHNLMIRETDEEIREPLVMLNRIKTRLLGALESRQDPAESVLNKAIAGEAALIWNYSHFAQTDLSSDVKQMFEYILFDHVDHLHHLVQAAQRLEKLEVQKLIGNQIPVRDGRSLEQQKITATDTLKGPLANHIDPLTWAHLTAMKSLEMAGKDRYFQVLENYSDSTLRQTCVAFSEIEEQHIDMLLSLENPGQSNLEALVVGQFTLNFLLTLFTKTETDETLRTQYQRMLELEDDVLRAAGQMLRQYTKKDPATLTHTNEEPCRPSKSITEFIDQLAKQPKRSQGKLFVTMIEEERKRVK